MKKYELMIRTDRKTGYCPDPKPQFLQAGEPILRVSQALKNKWPDSIFVEMTDIGVVLKNKDGGCLDGALLFYGLPLAMIVRTYKREFKKAPRVYNGEFDVTNLVFDRVYRRRSCVR